MAVLAFSLTFPMPYRSSASFLKGMVQDSNASCLDAALDAVLAFAEAFAKATDFSADLVPAMVTKGLSGRPGTASKAEEALLKLMEVRCQNDNAFVQLPGACYWAPPAAS